jgi:hypothetical protein
MHLRSIATSAASLGVLFWHAVASAQANAPPDAPPAQAPPPVANPTNSPLFISIGGDWTFGLHGIVGVSGYVQDTPDLVFNGQGILLPLSKPAGGFTTGADVRQTRFNFSVGGPQILGGATPKAVLEIDFFGLNGPGAFGEVSVLPRLRLAYTELNWGNDVVRLGQDHELIIGLVPESIGHQAYPATYFNGFIGWREPGIGYFHTIPVGDGKLELAAQVIKSDWENPADFGTSNLNDLNVDLGQLSGWPGVEGRVKYTGTHVMVFAAGHYNHVMGTHAGDLVVPPGSATGGILASTPTRNWDVYAGTAGIKVTAAGFTLGANGYAGRNLGPFLGALLQFPTTNDVSEWGAWGELGYEFTRHLNAWVLGGTSRPNQSDIEAAGGGRVSSSMVGGMIRYQEKGFALGPEYYHVMTKAITAQGAGAPSGAGAPDGEMDVNQLMLSGMYFF